MSLTEKTVTARYVATTRVMVAWNMKHAREKAYLDQGAIAAAMGLSQSQISKIESGLSDVSVTNLAMWALACGCKLSDLLEGL